MVQLEEVEDEAFIRDQPGLNDDDGDWDTDSVFPRKDSDISSLASDDEFGDESFIDRLSALKDVVPPAQRRKLGLVTAITKEWGWWGMQMAGKSLWVLSASVLLLGVPWALASTEDQQIAMDEKMQMQQQNANDVLAPGATSQQPL